FGREQHDVLAGVLGGGHDGGTEPLGVLDAVVGGRNQDGGVRRDFKRRLDSAGGGQGRSAGLGLDDDHGRAHADGAQLGAHQLFMGGGADDDGSQEGRGGRGRQPADSRLKQGFLAGQGVKRLGPGGGGQRPQA